MTTVNYRGDLLDRDVRLVECSDCHSAVPWDSFQAHIGPRIGKDVAMSDGKRLGELIQSQSLGGITIGAPGTPEHEAWEENFQANVKAMNETLRAGGFIVSAAEARENCRRNTEGLSDAAAIADLVLSAFRPDVTWAKAPLPRSKFRRVLKRRQRES